MEGSCFLIVEEMEVDGRAAAATLTAQGEDPLVLRDFLTSKIMTVSKPMKKPL